MLEKAVIMTTVKTVYLIMKYCRFSAHLIVVVIGAIVTSLR